MAAAQQGNCIKGQAFRSWLTEYEKLFGAQAKDTLVSALPDDVANAIRFGGIVTAGWYSIDWYVSLYEVHAKVGPKTAGFARKMGHATMSADMTGVYSFIVRMLSAVTVFTNSSRILRLYFQRCEAHVIEAVDGHGRVKIELPGATTALWDELAGGTEAILEANRATNVQCSVKVLSDGVAELSAKWSKSH